MSGPRIARVLIDSPLPQLDRLFDYAVPDGMEIDVGVRVRVPLRSAGRLADAYVIEVADAAATERPLSPVEAVVSAVPVVPPRLYALARRTADRAAGSASDILRLVVPTRQVRVEKAWLNAAAPEAPAGEPGALAAAEELLEEFPGLTDRIDAGGRLAIDAPPHTVEVAGTTVGAWARILAAAAVRTLARGRSAVLVVPDHRDLAQLTAALATLAPDGAVVRDDADQSRPDRYRAFLRMLADAPCIVVGKRSAVYAPVSELGLLVIWDDGDPLLGEPLAPYVHARDAALVRHELDGGTLLFAGHTRTTDVERLVGIGWVEDVPARRRESPRVVLTAPREGEAQGTRVPSAAFRAAREAVQHGPVLVQVARPGYAPVLVCAKCRTPARCRHCAGPLHAPGPRAAPVCAWCGRTAVRWACAECGHDRFRLASSGSERTADELGRAFPHVRVILADGEHPVTEVDARPALVVATRGAEPLAHGGYRAVILLDGDRMLLADDLRIGESCLRWWSNAAALAAPGAPVHLVGVDGPAARALATWMQPAYARTELSSRAAVRMPPAVRMATVEGEPASVDAALAALRQDVPSLTAESVLGPVPEEGTPRARALVRFEYGEGRAVAESLRAAVIARALRSRRGPRAEATRARNTLKVRFDPPDPQL